MTIAILAAVPFVMKIVMVFWVLAALILIFVILIQKGRGGGLSSAFGGIGNSLLGTKTGDFLTWVTICIVTIWLLLSIAAVKWYKPLSSEYLKSEVPQLPAPPAAGGAEEQGQGSQAGGEGQTDTSGNVQ